ncbi:MAG: hypothetical protein M0036_04800 [Desulfobacteraceae bacterium]|nr:hypothetical protein [Desulfobacteraceae bacterium]
MNKTVINRFISLLLALFCIITTYSTEGVKALLAITVALAPVLFCIWFGDLVGGITGFGGFRHPVVDKESPGCLVSALAWMALIALTVALAKQQSGH